MRDGIDDETYEQVFRPVIFSVFRHIGFIFFVCFCVYIDNNRMYIMPFYCYRCCSVVNSSDEGFFLPL